MSARVSPRATYAPYRMPDMALLETHGIGRRSATNPNGARRTRVMLAHEGQSNDRRGYGTARRARHEPPRVDALSRRGGGVGLPRELGCLVGIHVEGGAA